VLLVEGLADLVWLVSGKRFGSVYLGLEEVSAGRGVHKAALLHRFRGLQVLFEASLFMKPIVDFLGPTVLVDG
jgi:hypothetical protein